MHNNFDFNSHFDRHERSMNRMSKIFWFMFSFVALIIFAYWISVTVLTVKAVQCVGSSACLEETGRLAGSVVKGFKAGADGN